MGRNFTENGSGTRPLEDEGEVRKWGSALHLADALRPLADDLRDDHFGLPELQRLADDHRRTPGEKDLPGHLAVCPICLELFQSLLDGVPDVERPAMRRFETISGAPSRKTMAWWRSSGAVCWSAAALVALLLGSGILFRALAFPHSPFTAQGVVTRANGLPVLAGAAMPSGETVTLKQGARLELDDGGTSVRADAESTLSFDRTWRGNPRFVVHGGDVFIKAAKQKPGSSILVRTTLGDIRVVGTEFRVTVESEQVEVHESRPGQSKVLTYTDRISAVVVAVREGTVAVKNRHNQALVTAGETAVLRQAQPWIELRRE